MTGQRKKLYLAGPEVFLHAAAEIGDRKKQLCDQFGFIGLYPADADFKERDDTVALDKIIYRANLEMIRAADAGIFNLTPFRGPSADVGTVFELGLLTGLGKPAFAYTNDSASLLERIRKTQGAAFNSATGEWTDAQGLRVEDFDRFDNLMLEGALAEQGEDRLVRNDGDGTLDDLSGFIACLERAARYFGIEKPRELRAAHQS